MLKPARIALLLAAAAGAGAAGAALVSCQSDYTAYALTATGNILEFSTKNPSTIGSSTTVTLSGGVTNDSVVQMTAQPGTAALYCITKFGYLCTLDQSSGVATVVSSTPFTSTLPGYNSSFTLSNAVISFDPVSGDLRVISTGFNLLVDPNTGALAGTGSFTAVAFDSSDTNAGKTPVIYGIAYQNPVSGATNTTLYALESTTASLVRVGDADVGSSDTSIDSGDLHTIGPLNVSLSSNTGFAIGPSDGTGYASLQSGSGATLYTIDLSGGNATDIGSIGDGTQVINSLVISP